MTKPLLKLDPLPLEEDIADRISYLRRHHGATFSVARAQAFREYGIKDWILYAPRISQICGKRNTMKRKKQKSQHPGFIRALVSQNQKHINSI